MRVLLLFFLLLLLIAPVSHSQRKQVATIAANDRVVHQTPNRGDCSPWRALVKGYPKKRRATITYPVVSGLKDAGAWRRVQSILQVKNVFDSSVAEYRRDRWLDEFSYKVNFNKNGILDITFSQSGSGAYPDAQSRHFAINLKNGSIIKASDVFVAGKLMELSATVNKELQAELQEILKSKQEANSDPEDIRTASEAQEPLEFKVENLDNFSVGNKGLTFLYDAGYRHVIQAFEPNGRYFFSYSELKAHLKRDGPLGQFLQ
ncbi:MAG: hypothetical protein ACREA9_07835 [Pyrinomonadaceae bacterium]